MPPRALPGSPRSSSARTGGSAAAAAALRCVCSVVALAEGLQQVQEEVDEIQVQLEGRKSVHVDGVLALFLASSRGFPKDQLCVVDDDEAEEHGSKARDDPVEHRADREEDADHAHDHKCQQGDEDVSTATREVG